MDFQNPGYVDAHGSTFNDVRGHQFNIAFHTSNPGAQQSCFVLIRHHQSRLSPILGSNLPLTSVPNAPLNSTGPGAKPVPSCSELFTGRKDYLKNLRQYFCRRDVSSPRRRFLLYGMGGAGKTQICLKFAEENSDLSASAYHCLPTLILIYGLV